MIDAFWIFLPCDPKNIEGIGDIFSKKAVPTRVTRYKVPEGICHWYRRDDMPEDSVLRLNM
jgi:hypothetical protein